MDGRESWLYLPSVSKPEDAATSDGDPLYFVFNYDGKDVNAAKATKEYKTYGVLYNWYAAMNQKERNRWKCGCHTKWHSRNLS